jgi:hypothetical protein
MYFKIFVLIFLIYSCQENDKSSHLNSNNNQSSPVEPNKTITKPFKKSQEKDSVKIRTEKDKTTVTKIYTNKAKVLSDQKTKNQKAVKEVIEKKQETPNEYLQKKEEWDERYSKDATWIDLYNTSEASFIKGVDNEFIKNPALVSTVNKSFLTHLFSKKMEKLFFNYPSFIQFSTDRFTVSEAFYRLQSKWNIPN